MAAKRAIMYEIIKPIALLSIQGSITKELNVVSWNGQPAKYDLRVWRRDADGNKIAGKGITLDADEMESLSKAIDRLQDAGQGFPRLEQ